MSYKTVIFLEKEYAIPTDVVTYVDLVDFTNEIRDALIASFKKQIWPSIDVIESDNFMITTLNDQASKFVRKLLDNDIYNRTANDYLQNNKGYELFLDTKKKVLRQLVSIRKEKLETYRAGVEDAISRKEASVTGLDFGIISGSFVNHMIYAYMDASKQTKQEQEALKAYNREIAELDKQAAEYDRQENAYISDSVIPAMNAVFTHFSYELLDSFIADLIKAGKFDAAALDFIDLKRSDDLLKNLELSNNRKAIIESAFVACPFNMAVYMQAMKYDLLDYNSFLTANSFKQGNKILEFLKESVGVANYPKYTQPNLYSATLLSRYTNKTVDEVLFQHTASYANAVMNEYAGIITTIGNPSRYYEFLNGVSEDEILAGENTARRIAELRIRQIVSESAWTSLVGQCGHGDLFAKLLALLPIDQNAIKNKSEYDNYVIEWLSLAVENARKMQAQRIEAERTQAEEKRQKEEEKEKKKRIKTTVICGVIAAAIIFAISLPSTTENAKTSKRESYVEDQIQAVIVPLEREMENATGVDVIIDYYFSLENDWDNEQWYEWTFSVELPVFEEYRKSNSATEQSLLEVMDVCKTLVEIYDDIYDDLDFEFKNEDARIVMDFSGGNFGSLKIHDTSTTETFYYEEYGGERHLHSYDTEYILEK